MNFHFVNLLDHDASDALALNRGLLYGDGFFTTGLIQNGNLLEAESHWRRLEESARRLKFTQFSLELLAQAMQHYLSPVEDAAFRLTCYRTQPARGYAIDHQCQQNEFLLQVFPRPSVPKSPCRLFIAETPVSVNTRLAGIKHLNRLDNVLAASEIRSADEEALLCQGEQVICGSRTNLFVLIDQVWQTPSLALAGIEGITRHRLLSYFEQRQLAHSVNTISRTALLRADAAIVTNSLLGLWPVVQIGDKLLDTNAAEAIKSDFLAVNS